MSNTKQKILDTSKNLFNKYGYSQVTIRMIALELGMSSGNLNYHFKKREEILAALYFEMVHDFDQRISTLSSVEISFTQILNDILFSMERMVNYKFIWTDLFNILRANEKISTHFYTVYSARIEGNRFLFDRLCEMGLMRQASFSKEFEILAERMINFGDTWIYTSELYQKKNSKKNIENQAHAMLVMIYPYLTKKGVKEFEKIIPNFAS